MDCVVENLVIGSFKLGLPLYVDYNLRVILIWFFFSGIPNCPQSISTKSLLNLEESENFSADDVSKLLDSFPDAKTYNLAFILDENFKHTPGFQTILTEAYTDTFKKLSVPDKRINIRIIIPAQSRRPKCSYFSVSFHS